MPKMESAIAGPRFDRPKTGFLFAVALASLAYVGLLYIIAEPWRTVGTLAPFVVILALLIARVMSGHYQYKIERLRSQPVSGIVGYNVKPGKGGRAGEPVVKPVFINDSKSGGRHVLK